MRGIFIAEFNTIKQNAQVQKEKAVHMVHQLEVELIAKSSDVTRDTWIAVQVTMDRLATYLANKKLFFSKLTFYEEGEQTVWLLPKIVHQTRLPLLSELYAPIWGR